VQTGQKWRVLFRPLVSEEQKGVEIGDYGAQCDLRDVRLLVIVVFGSGPSEDRLSSR